MEALGRRWSPPAGIERIFRWHPEEGCVHVTLRADCEMRTYAVETSDVGEACRCLEVMARDLLGVGNQPAPDRNDSTPTGNNPPTEEGTEVEVELPTPAWLLNTFHAIRYVDQHTPLFNGVEWFTTWLLLAIEADNFMQPAMAGTVDCGLELLWVRDDGRRLVVAIHRPGKVWIRREEIHGGVVSSALGSFHGRQCQPALLDAIEWLEPDLFTAKEANGS
jgi:hypothetical protein